MRILQLISSGGFYGAENVLVELVTAFNKTESFAPVVGVFENSLSPHLEVIDECNKRGVPYKIFNCKGRVDLKAVLTLRRFIRTNKIDVIHSHGYKSNLYAYLASRGLRISIVATCHNWLGESPKMKFYAALDRFILKKFGKVVAVSEDVKKILTKSGVSSGDVRIIRNGISLDRFNIVRPENLRRELGISGDALVIGTVGRISEEKGHEFLLKAASNVFSHYQKAEFLIVGDGVLKNYLQDKYTSPLIHFTGIRRDIPELLRTMNIFVLPSLTEGLPMALLEAMAAKLPVVASAVGAIPSIIENYVNGILVKSGSEQELEKALVFVIENKERREDMAQRGFEKVRDEFSSEKMANEYIKIYKNLLKSTSTDYADCADF